MSGFWKQLAKPSLNWLLVFFPISIALEVAHGQGAAWASSTMIFAAAAIAIIPVAGWMGHATEHLASRLGEGVGGLLNATFGNAAELIIAVMALVEATRHPEKVASMHAIIKASLTGSIIGNILLVLGAALLAGGIKYKIQRFSPLATRTAATLMTLAIIALTGPTLLARFVPAYAGEIHSVQVEHLSLEVAVILLVVYALSLFFTLHTHKQLYSSGEAVEEAGIDDPVAVEAAHDRHAPWSVRKAMAVLIGATVCVAVLAELMVGSVEEASHAIGLTELFVGVIVVAIVGNAAEHSTAVLVALRNRMDLSLSIAIGSSIQIALFVAPALVWISYFMGVPMDLVFTVPEIVAMALAVTITAQIAGDGESNWLEGVLLLVVYVLLGALFYYLPAEAHEVVPSVTALLGKFTCAAC
ncbi:MAG: calcium/proton exchanger [Planctomycetia bacterium]|nr:calcium/proton exchanger [Planctomycetia bacterium]